MPAKTHKPSLYIPDGLLKQGMHGKAEIVHMDVPDPMPDPNREPGQRIRAAVNIRRDVLLFEYGRGRISDGAYVQGRVIQQALEIRGGSGQSQWFQGDRVDAGSLVALAIARNLDAARLAMAVIGSVRRELGKIDSGVVITALRQPSTWAMIAAARGDASHEHQKMLAWRFRQSLEHLAEHPVV